MGARFSTAIEQTNQGVEHAGSLIGDATHIAADTNGIRDELGRFLQKLRA